MKLVKLFELSAGLPVTGCCYSPDGGTIATYSRGGTLGFYHASTGNAFMNDLGLRSCVDRDTRVNEEPTIRFLPDGRTILLVFRQLAAIVGPTSSIEKRHFAQPVRDLRLLGDHQHAPVVAATYHAGYVDLLDMRGDYCRVSLGDRPITSALALSRRSQLVAVTSGTSKVEIIDLRDGTLRTACTCCAEPHHVDALSKAAFSADGRYLAVVTQRGEVTVIDTDGEQTWRPAIPAVMPSLRWALLPLPHSWFLCVNHETGQVVAVDAVARTYYSVVTAFEVARPEAAVAQTDPLGKRLIVGGRLETRASDHASECGLVCVYALASDKLTEALALGVAAGDELARAALHDYERD